MPGDADIVALIPAPGSAAGPDTLIYADAQGTTQTQYTTPTSWLGRTVTFRAIDGDIWLKVGSAAQTVVIATNSSEAAGVLTGDPETGWPIPVGEERDYTFGPADTNFTTISDQTGGRWIGRVSSNG